MNYLFRFAHPFLLLALIFLILGVIVIRYFFKKNITLRYSLVKAIADHGYMAHLFPIRLLWFLRVLSLLLLAALIARPQLVDVKSKIHADGIDIMLVLDVSGSMQCFDDMHDPRSRFEVAKKEALEFIKKRDNDQIGLVLFGSVAVTRAPLTADKNILTTIINDLKLGDINPDGTVLSIATSMAVQRLSNSKAKSKIIILLTDGEPTPELDIDPQLAIDLAKKFGIKIYAIGIGDEHGGLFVNPIFNVVQHMGFRLNKELLYRIAQQTGGQFYHAKKPDDLRKIYQEIDALEKTEYETTIFSKYYELIIPFVSIIAALLGSELILNTFVWFLL